MSGTIVGKPEEVSEDGTQKAQLEKGSEPGIAGFNNLRPPRSERQKDQTLPPIYQGQAAGNAQQAYQDNTGLSSRSRSFTGRVRQTWNEPPIIEHGENAPPAEKPKVMRTAMSGDALPAMRKRGKSESGPSPQRGLRTAMSGDALSGMVQRMKIEMGASSHGDARTALSGDGISKTPQHAKSETDDVNRATSPGGSGSVTDDGMIMSAPSLDRSRGAMQARTRIAASMPNVQAMQAVESSQGQQPPQQQPSKPSPSPATSITHPPPPMKSPSKTFGAIRENPVSRRKLLPSFLTQPITGTSRLFDLHRIVCNVIHAFTLIQAPLFMAWTDEFDKWPWVIVYFIVDLYFLMDCWLRSRKVFKNRYGIAVVDRREIARHWFWTCNGWVDLVASLPWDMVVLLGNYRQVSVNFAVGRSPDWQHDVMFFKFKVWGILRFLKLLLRLPYKNIFNASIAVIPVPISRLIKTMLILMCMGHIDACLFWFIDNTLQPPNRWMDNIFNTSESSELGSHTTPFSSEYLMSYLSALATLVLKLRTVGKNEEAIYVIFEFVAGILVYGTVFGNIHSIVEMLDHTAALTAAEETHKFQMDWLKRYMREKGFSPHLQKVIASHKEIQWRRSQGMDEAHLFDDIPKSLQQEIKNFLYLDMIKKVPLFQDSDNAFLNSVAFKMKPLVVLDGMYIFRKNDEGEEMFFIKNGKVEICGDAGNVFATLSPGSFFGEIALFEDTKRTASARALGDVELCVLNKEDFKQIMTQHPTIAEQIQATIRKRRENEAKVKAEALAKEEEERVRKETASNRAGLRRRNGNASRLGTLSRRAMSGIGGSQWLGSRIINEEEAGDASMTHEMSRNTSAVRGDGVSFAGLRSLSRSISASISKLTGLNAASATSATNDNGLIVPEGGDGTMEQRLVRVIGQDRDESDNV
ncbi:hypothetical protein HDU85_004081 [Gaertneriomyces sp. JEL0708]|nr:hypothetical protein HDU85_004081 [Gaertneriomyces sp. JEL0708]